MTFSHSLSTNNYGPAKFIVATSAAEGTHTTLAAALTAASSGDTIYLRDSVTENPTLKAGVNICAWQTDASLNATGKVKIIGKSTMTTAGTVNISGIELKTNSDFYLAVTGSADSVVNLNNCFLNASNNTGISYTSSGTGSKIVAFNCYGDVGTTGIAPFACSGSGSITYNQCVIGNSGGASTACTVSAGTIGLSNTLFSSPITTSGTGGINDFYSIIDTQATNSTSLTHGGSGTANVCVYAEFLSGSATAVSIGATLVMGNCIVNSTNTNAVSGAGTLFNGGITFTNTSSKINTSSQTARNLDIGGISFDGGTNVLNAYSTSTWTPTIIPSGTAFTSITYAAQSGTWTKIGNMVVVQAYVAASAVTIGPATGDLNFPLPFAASASSVTVSTGSMRCDNQTISGKYVYSSVGTSGTAAVAQMSTSAGATTNLPASGATANMGFSFTLMYRF